VPSRPNLFRTSRRTGSREVRRMLALTAPIPCISERTLYRRHQPI
jgi:hypothetical protein